MSNDEFTPTEWEVRDEYAAGNIHAEAEFDRMIAEVERAAAARARGEALIEAVQAHLDLHRTYGSTSACRGGIGGQALTSHCGEICCNADAHEPKRPHQRDRVGICINCGGGLNVKDLLDGTNLECSGVLIQLRLEGMILNTLMAIPVGNGQSQRISMSKKIAQNLMAGGVTFV